MPPRTLTAEDVIGWLTPPEALAILDEAFGKTDISKHTLIEHLKGGMVQAVSRHSVWEGAREARRKVIFPIPSDHWEHYDHSYGALAFWVTGQITLKLGREYGTDQFISVQHFGVRFGPEGVNAMIPKPSKIHQPEPEIGSEQKGPAISLSNLQAWFEFYKKIGGEMREGPALASAKMNFPRNSISRQKIRDLLPSRQMGRPKTRDN